MRKILLFLFTLMWLSNAMYANIDSLWNQYNSSNRNVEFAKSILNYYALQVQYIQRDSAFQIMLQKELITKSSLDEQLYRTYFSCKEFASKDLPIQEAENWAKMYVNQKASIESFYAYKNLFEISQKYQIRDRADYIANELFYTFNSTDNKAIRAATLLIMGQNNQSKNKNNEAYKNYLDAYYIALQLKDKELTMEAQHHISNFFQLNKINFKAKKSKLTEIEYYTQNYTPIDSNVYYKLVSELADILFDGDQAIEANQYSKEILSYCIRTKNKQLLDDQLLRMRSYYFEKNNLNELYKLYHQDFPDELIKLKTSNPVSYYRLLSLFEEKDCNFQKAKIYFDSAEVFITSPNKSSFEKSNFYNRKGEFYLRQNMNKMAIDHFVSAYFYAKETNFLPFFIKATKNLDSAYSLMSDYKNAHKFSTLTMNYTDSLSKSTNNDEVSLLEIENVERQKELMVKQEEDETKRKHNLQYMFIVISIAFGFIILLFAGTFKVHKFVIKTLGFFVFIFLFEFIILLADNQIHHATHGEPIKVMGLKIILIAFLLPLHHYVEEKVVHYLLHHKIIDNVKFRTLLAKLIVRTKHKLKEVAEEKTEPSLEATDSLV